MDSQAVALDGAQVGTTMPFSHSLADRVRQVLGRGRGVAEKKMFGGVGFLLDRFDSAAA